MLVSIFSYLRGYFNLKKKFVTHSPALQCLPKRPHRLRTDLELSLIIDLTPPPPFFKEKL